MLSRPWQKSQDSGTTGETACPTELDQQFASVVGQAFSLSRLLRRAITKPLPRGVAYGLVSILLLLPVYWQPRVQAGDLTRHLDNAWLARSIESGQALGVVLKGPPRLFDVILAGLYHMAGAEFAQRLCISLAVLTFIWGAFTFVSAVGGRKPWYLMPCIAMLAYGWVFHMGFFNFYLSMGLCFWALALGWNVQLRLAIIAAALMGLAYLAHPIPAIWTAELFCYLWMARRAGAPRYIFVTAAGLVVIIAGSALANGTVHSGALVQIAGSVAADQMWVFDTKYYFVLIGLLLVWGLLFIALMRRGGAGSVFSGLPFQLCMLSAAAIFFLPSTVLIPGSPHILVYYAERMSLGVGVCFCALLATGQPRAFERCALVMLSLVFFCFLYGDERARNSFEDQMMDTVARVSHHSSVFSRQLLAVKRTRGVDSATDN